MSSKQKVPPGSGSNKGDPPGKGQMIGALVSVVAGVAIVGFFVYLLNVLALHPPVLKATQTASTSKLVKASLNIATYPDSMAGEHGKSGGAHPNWVSYGPTTNFSVPAHALVTVTIRNYDTATTLNNPFFGQVQGTVGQSAKVNGKTFKLLSGTAVAHTFTIHMFPSSSQPNLDVNVPLLGVSPSAPNLSNGYPKPTVTTFQFKTGAPGRYIWQCFDPCGGKQYYRGFGGPMSTLGYMAGTLTVVGGNAGA